MLFRSALRQTFCIETGDDPDKYASEERAPKEDHRAELVKLYYARAQEAAGLNIDNAPILDTMTEADIIAAGKELKARIDEAKKGK